MFFVLGVGNGDDDSTKAAPTSQIPGLSDDANNGPEERTKGRRTGVNESDSAYTKLAKQGGQRGKNGILFDLEITKTIISPFICGNEVSYS